MLVWSFKTGVEMLEKQRTIKPTGNVWTTKMFEQRKCVKLVGISPKFEFGLALALLCKIANLVRLSKWAKKQRNGKIETKTDVEMIW